MLGRVDRVQRLRNKIAHQSPRIEHGVVHFLDGSLTAEQFEAEIKDARELSLELLDTLFPQVIERRRRWGARDVDEMDRLGGRRCTTTTRRSLHDDTGDGVVADQARPPPGRDPAAPPRGAGPSDPSGLADPTSSRSASRRPGGGASSAQEAGAVS